MKLAGLMIGFSMPRAVALENGGEILLMLLIGLPKQGGYTNLVTESTLRKL